VDNRTATSCWTSRALRPLRSRRTLLAWRTLFALFARWGILTTRGKRKGQRHIAGGRGRLRRSLYAAALPAAFRWNKALVELYARLIARGKAHNAILIACARKLLVYANTVVQRGTPWIESAVRV